VTQGLRIERQVRFRRKGRVRRIVHEGGVSSAKGLAVATLPRISRLMALAIRFDHLARSKAVADQADSATSPGHASPRS